MGKESQELGFSTRYDHEPIEKNSELIRTLTFEIEDLRKLIEELIKITPPPPKE